MQHSRGFITKKRYVGEADVLLSVFSRDWGPMRVMARGARKIESKMASHLQLFNCIDYSFVTGKRHHILTAGSAAEALCGLHDDMVKSALLAYGMECAEKFSVPGKNPRLWEWLEALVGWLMRAAIENESQHEFVLAKINMFFLEMHGWRPEIERCARCGNAIGTLRGFSYREGGMVCRDCCALSAEAVMLSGGAAEVIASVSGKRDGVLASAEAAREARTVLEQFLSHMGAQEIAAGYFADIAQEFSFS